MPTLTDICRAAKLDRDTLNTLERSGRTADWGDRQSKGYAIRVGLFAALRVSGFLAPAAAAMAHSMAGQEFPRLLIRGPLEGPAGTERRVYSNALDNAPLQDLFELAAADTGRQVIGDGPPDPELDAVPKADVLVVIDVPAVVRRMTRLFEEA
ncbi:hypothetical protein [Aestuariivirga sp.]|uniref:hypothetical protein n=1 Tax=Aestuariivirga sp. TaxID=2650926 RepID=UPI0037832B4B